MLGPPKLGEDTPNRGLPCLPVPEGWNLSSVVVHPRLVMALPVPHSPSAPSNRELEEGLGWPWLGTDLSFTEPHSWLSKRAKGLPPPIHRG